VTVPSHPSYERELLPQDFKRMRQPNPGIEFRAETPQGNPMQERLDAVFSRFEGKANELIPVLQAVQAEFGYLPQQAMLAIGRFCGVPESRVYAVATFSPFTPSSVSPPAGRLT